MAAASPSARLNETLDSTRRAPRGDGYSFVRSATCSKGPGIRRALRGTRDSGVVRRKQSIGGSRDRVVLSDTVEPAIRQRLAQTAIAPQTVDRLGERVLIVRPHEQTTAGLLDDFRERASPGLDDGNAGGKRLEQEHALGLVVGCWHGKQIEGAEKRQFAHAIDRAMIRELMGETRLLEIAANLVEVRFLRAPEIPGNLQPDRRAFGPIAKALVRAGKQVQTFFRR